MLRTRSRASRWWRLAALAALLVPFFAAPATLAQDADTESTPEAAPAYYSDTMGPPVPGGVANFLLYEDPDTLNPLLEQSSIAEHVTAVILEGLAYHDPDGNYQPALAAELPTLENGGVSEDLAVVTWKLKPDVVWSDGEPFTSDDVKFTWEAAKDVTNGAADVSEYELIANVETPDPATVVVTYSSFNAAYLDQFPYILPKHATGPLEEMRPMGVQPQPDRHRAIQTARVVAGRVPDDREE